MSTFDAEQRDLMRKLSTEFLKKVAGKTNRTGEKKDRDKDKPRNQQL